MDEWDWYVHAQNGLWINKMWLSTSDMPYIKKLNKHNIDQLIIFVMFTFCQNAVKWKKNNNKQGNESTGNISCTKRGWLK